jgi:hypothetical protein
MPRPNINYAERNAKMRAEFNAYCEAHPAERFWEALRNWVGCTFIYASEELGDYGYRINATDTLYWEGRNGTDL